MKLKTALNKRKIYPPINSLSEIISRLSIERKEAEILTAFLLNKSRELILSHPEIELDQDFYKKIKDLEKKRLKNYPLAYLTGQQEFYGLNFKVNKNVMVPRPETEMMVDKIIDIFKKEANDDSEISNPLIIDIGTGSGAIIIGLASELKRLMSFEFKSTEFKAIDISIAALKVARNNAQLNGLNKTIKFYCGNLLDPVKKFLSGRNLIIAANLPYLTLKQVKGSPSISREPKLALVAGADGLKYYRELFKQLADLKYKTLTLFCEIDPNQNELIVLLAKDYFLGGKLEIIKDLAGLDRFLKIVN